MAMRKLKKYVPTKFKAKKYVYDRDAADYAVNFIQALCHTKGTWAGKPFELIDWQEQIIRDLFGIIKPNGTMASYDLKLLGYQIMSGSADCFMQLKVSGRQESDVVWTDAENEEQTGKVGKYCLILNGLNH